MPEICGEPHPEHPEVTCEKQTPCYDLHYNLAAQREWVGRLHPPPPPPAKSRKAAAANIAGGIPPAPTTGPPTVDEPGAKLRHRPHDTEVGAAVSTLPRSGTQRRRVYDALLVAGERGLTDEEIQHLLVMNPSTVRPRRLELVEQDLVMDSQRRRKVASGDQAIVWIIR